MYSPTSFDADCYNPKFDLGYNLSKDLSKSRKYDQLVKHKNTYNYIYLITIRNRLSVLEKRMRKEWREHNKASTTAWDADW